MSERTIIAVVSDLIKTGLTVEQQILVNELAVAKAVELERARVKSENAERVRKQRAAQCSTVQHPPIPPRDKTKNKTPLNPPCEPLFEGFWAAYPRKVAKRAALKAFRHALTRASHAEILAGAKRYSASKPDPKFTAHPASWLNADRWLDEPVKPNVTVTTGPWKPFKPEAPDPEKPPLEEREKQLAKLNLPQPHRQSA